MKRRIFSALLTSALLFITGCGYHWGSIMHPQVKSIAIAPVVNETTAYNVASDMRMMLAEQFTLDGSLELTSLETSDCILETRVLSVKFTEIDDDSYDASVIYRPSEWRVEVEAEFRVIIPGVREPLIKPRKVTGRALFKSQADMETNRIQATRMACSEAAKLIIIYTTEAW